LPVQFILYWLQNKKKKPKTRRWLTTTLFKNRERYWKLVIGTKPNDVIPHDDN
jgi:hypothetical protein